MSRARPTKHVRELLELAGQLGFELERTKGGHLVFRKPGRQPVFSSSTPSDVRTIRNLKGQLVRSERGDPT